MKVRWLGNSAVEIEGDKNILIDPAPLNDITIDPDVVLVTHEHDDHFDPELIDNIAKDVDLYAPKPTLEKFNIQGVQVENGDTLGDIEVLDCNCWKSKESVAYSIEGVLQTGDSNVFPEPDKPVKLVFSACFPENYEDYIEEARKLNPDMVIPFHYNPKEDMEDAERLKSKLEKNNINSKTLDIKQEINI